MTCYHNMILSLLLVIVTLACDCWAYKPVVLIHGIFDRRNSLEFLANRISQVHSGTEVIILDKFHRYRSLTAMWDQVKAFKKMIRPIMQNNPEGIHLIGFSQGGLVARALIQSMHDHNVDTFISLSAPQGGQYGDEFLKILFPKYVKKEVWRVFYRETGQSISVGNYWRDPHHLQAFYNHSKFLPYIDNEIITENSDRLKNNFMRLGRAILIGGPNDGVISPWQSSHFGCYNEMEEVVGMKQREIYNNDLFGLKTLDDEGKILKLTIPHVAHLQWHKNVTVIDSHIVPYLN